MSKTIQEVVAEKISACGQTVIDTVVEKLAEVEISKRVEIITKAIAVQDQANGNLKKIDRNDIVTYVDGNQVQSMSKARYDDIKKAKENLEKLTKAIDAALTENTTDTYNKLNDLLKNAGNNKAESTDSSK